MGWRLQWVILIFTLRDFWDPDSRGREKYNEKQRERKREKGHQWVTSYHARAPVPRGARGGQGMLQKATEGVADNEGKLEA